MPFERLKKYHRLWGILAAIVFLGLCIYNLNFQSLTNSLTKLEYGYLLPALACGLTFGFLRSQRWRTIIEPQKKISTRRIYRLFMIGQLANAALPTLTGQVVRIWLLSKKEGLSKTFAFTTVMLEVAFDSLALLIFMMAISTTEVIPRWLLRGEVAGLIGLLILFGLFYIILKSKPTVLPIVRSNSLQIEPNKPFGLPRLWLNLKLVRLPMSWIKRLENFFASVSAGLSMLKSTRHLFQVFLLSILAWLAQAGTILVLNKAFDLKVPLWAAFVVMVINTIALTIPITPGNLGTFQVACTFALSIFGVPKEQAFSFSVVLYIIDLLPPILLGTYFLLTEHLHVRDLKTPEVLAYGFSSTMEFSTSSSDKNHR